MIAEDAFEAKSADYLEGFAAALLRAHEVMAKDKASSMGKSNTAARALRRWSETFFETSTIVAGVAHRKRGISRATSEQDSERGGL